VDFITIRTRDDGQDRIFCLDIGHERPLLTYYQRNCQILAYNTVIGKLVLGLYMSAYDDDRIKIKEDIDMVVSLFALILVMNDHC
jgi:hypothetical protein